MVANQKKMVREGEGKREVAWELNINAIGQNIDWARSNPQHLAREIAEITATFPTFLVSVGTSSGWGMGAKLLPCPKCQEMLVFWNGLRCVRCEGEYKPDKHILLALVGRIPCLLGKVITVGVKKEIQGRPYLGQVMRRIGSLKGANKKRRFQNYLIATDDGTVYFAPPLYSFYSRNWPHSEPFIMVEPDYFNILGIEPAHVWIGAPRYRLCIYANWREVPMKTVLLQRIQPRILIDLMVADLVVTGKLKQALSEAQTSLYNLYNRIGKPEGERFKQVYQRHIQI